MTTKIRDAATHHWSNQYDCSAAETGLAVVADQSSRRILMSLTQLQKLNWAYWHCPCRWLSRRYSAASKAAAAGAGCCMQPILGLPTRAQLLVSYLLASSAKTSPTWRLFTKTCQPQALDIRETVKRLICIDSRSSTIDFKLKYALTVCPEFLLILGIDRRCSPLSRLRIWAKAFSTKPSRVIFSMATRSGAFNWHAASATLAPFSSWRTRWPAWRWRWVWLF